MSNLTNLVAEQFQELNDTYEAQKKHTQETFLYKQQECESEHKEAIAQINIELKSNEAQLLSLIRKIEEKRGAIVTVEELASVLTLIADPVNIINLDNITNSTNSGTNNSSVKKSHENKTTDKDKDKAEISNNTATKPKSRYKGKYYR